ncbi:MAG: ATP-dependent DNA ligase [Flavipsychrobacter sp.]|nr:ATP-dependent DNA ligase [Flavipsychrobacter sp.]
MRAFSKLFTAIDQTTSINEKIDALVRYLQAAEPKDAVWTVALLTGNRPRRTVKTSELWAWCTEQRDIPGWLIAESYHVVGDLAETLSLLLPENPGHALQELHLHEVINNLIALKDKDDSERKAYITGTWKMLSKPELFVFNKLITGGFRVGVSAKIIIKALARHFNIDENVVAHRLSGQWSPAETTLPMLLSDAAADSDSSRPYPFYLAYQLETTPEELGDPNEWQIERKYDGIRGQLIVRGAELFVWSRGEDLLTEKFVEFHPLKDVLPPGTVLDGEILPVKNGNILPFHVMQTRIGRKNITRKALQEAPLAMMCYDLLEYDGNDIRHRPLSERRALLQQVLDEVSRRVGETPLLLSPLVEAASWDEVAAERLRARDHQCEGLMLKRKNSPYKTGRKKGDWWKWKVDPLSVDGVLIYAQRGHGRRANMYTDFTLAVWDGDELVPFAKAYSGLTDKELNEVDNWIKKNTTDKFGPVRSVVPFQVFEIGFEGINPSPRHKSGIALRFPRILRWRKDKSPAEANTKNDLLQLLQAQQ